MISRKETAAERLGELKKARLCKQLYLGKEFTKFGQHRCRALYCGMIEPDAQLICCHALTVSLPALLKQLKGYGWRRGSQLFAPGQVSQKQGLESRHRPNHVKAVFAYQSVGASGAIRNIATPIGIQQDHLVNIRSALPSPAIQFGDRRFDDRQRIAAVTSSNVQMDRKARLFCVALEQCGVPDFRITFTSHKITTAL